MSRSISRRGLLKCLSAGLGVNSMLRVITIKAAEHTHRIIRAERSQTAAGTYTPKFFDAHGYKTLQSLCQAIIPPDERSGGAIEAGAPEFIDLLTSENKQYQLTLGGGLLWLDATCRDRYSRVFLECRPVEQNQILDLVAFSANAAKNPSLSQGVKFFAFLRNLTLDGFYTSEIGIKDLQYIGNTYLAEFPGCPPVPES
jgi:gluconate 2-dehydrogenase subunit 3-like protein